VVGDRWLVCDGFGKIVTERESGQSMEGEYETLNEIPRVFSYTAGITKQEEE